MDLRDNAVKFAIQILESRRRRSDHLPAHLFGEAGWALLLILFVADAKGERVTAKEACRRSGEVYLVALRWLRVLEADGLANAGQATDQDDRVVSLTPRGLDAVEACLTDVQMAATTTVASMIVAEL